MSTVMGALTATSKISRDQNLVAYVVGELKRCQLDFMTPEPSKTEFLDSDDFELGNAWVEGL